jgi:hypothetical protein
VLRILKRKDKAVDKWRSRGWSIDPKKTKLTIIKVGASNLDDSAENEEIADLNLVNTNIFLSSFMDKSQMFNSCIQGINVLTDMEQVSH